MTSKRKTLVKERSSLKRYSHCWMLFASIQVNKRIAQKCWQFFVANQKLRYRLSFTEPGPKFQNACLIEQFSPATICVAAGSILKTTAANGQLKRRTCWDNLLERTVLSGRRLLRSTTLRLMKIGKGHPETLKTNGSKWAPTTMRRETEVRGHCTKRWPYLISCAKRPRSIFCERKWVLSLLTVVSTKKDASKSKTTRCWSTIAKECKSTK